jgi:hypothetical protein
MMTTDNHESGNWTGLVLAIFFAATVALSGGTEAIHPENASAFNAVCPEEQPLCDQTIPGGGGDTGGSIFDDGCGGWCSGSNPGSGGSGSSGGGCEGHCWDPGGAPDESGTGTVPGSVTPPFDPGSGDSGGGTRGDGLGDGGGIGGIPGDGLGDGGGIGGIPGGGEIPSPSLEFCDGIWAAHEAADGPAAWAIYQIWVKCELDRYGESSSGTSPLTRKKKPRHAGQARKHRARHASSH